MQLISNLARLRIRSDRFTDNLLPLVTKVLKYGQSRSFVMRFSGLRHPFFTYYAFPRFLKQKDIP